MLHWAVPSFVIPGTVAENVAFLEKRQVPEIALCFFEEEACLAYGAKDLPPSLNMRCHVHLPCDLDWREGGKKVARTAKTLFAKAKPFAPSLAVLHPPVCKEKEKLLFDFLDEWSRLSSSPICLENIKAAPLLDLPLALFGEEAFGLCIDFGHMLCFHQENLLDSPLLSFARILHWSCPLNGQDKHKSLHLLKPRERNLALQLLRGTREDAIQLIEVFQWKSVQESLPILFSLWNEVHPFSPEKCNVSQKKCYFN